MFGFKSNYLFCYIKDGRDMKNLKRSFLSVILAMVLVVFVSGDIAYAAYANGSKSYVTVYGHKYEYSSSVTSQSGEVWSHASVGSATMENLPTGYIGANARLYNSAGTLIKSSGWLYSDSACGGISNKTPTYYTNSGTYYGKGQVKMYNGNGYNTYTTTQSPNVQAFTLVSIEDIYSINEKGETYGSEILLNQYGIEPDLIETLGDNGVLGYVKAIDLEENVPDTLEGVIEYQKNLPNERKIPLYESDGETIIGNYTIYYNQGEKISY